MEGADVELLGADQIIVRIAPVVDLVKIIDPVEALGRAGAVVRQGIVPGPQAARYDIVGQLRAEGTLIAPGCRISGAPGAVDLALLVHGEDMRRVAVRPLDDVLRFVPAHQVPVAVYDLAEGVEGGPLQGGVGGAVDA